MGTSPRTESGFTLVELLIMVVILGILAGIVVFAVGNLGTSAQESVCKAERVALEEGIEAYRANTNDRALEPDQTELLASNQIKQTTPNWVITYDGAHVANVDPVAGQACD